MGKQMTLPFSPSEQKKIRRKRMPEETLKEIEKRVKDSWSSISSEGQLAKAKDDAILLIEEICRTRQIDYTDLRGVEKKIYEWIRISDPEIVDSAIRKTTGSPLLVRALNVAHNVRNEENPPKWKIGRMLTIPGCGYQTMRALMDAMNSSV